MAEHSPEMQAAIAAMRAEWEQVGPVILREDDPEMPDDERTASLARRSDLLRDFWLRHGPALAAVNPGVEMPTIDDLDTRKAEFLQADEAAKKAEEEYLQASADVAEAREKLVESLLEVLAGLEALSEEQWAAMEELQRAQAYEMLRKLQEQREGLLASLPAERREYWEKR